MTEGILLVACLVLAVAVGALGMALVQLRGQLRRLAAPVVEEVAQRPSRDQVTPTDPPGLVTGASAPSSTTSGSEFVITRLGTPDAEEPAPMVETKLFADLVLRESVVKAASFVHGVRRGLAPANRNRIWFEMRREVKRARKDRRAEEREAIREWRARKRASVRESEAA